MSEVRWARREERWREWDCAAIVSWRVAGVVLVGYYDARRWVWGGERWAWPRQRVGRA